MLKPTYGNFFGVSGCLFISFIDHQVTKYNRGNRYLLAENAGLTDGQKKVNSLQNGEGDQ